MQTVPREVAPPLFATRQGFRRDLKPEPNGESHGKQPQTSFKPRIYVACLAAYNSGYLHGTWIDAAQEPWGIYDEVKAILAASPIAGAEECAIHDYEDFDGVRIEEYSGFERVSAIADFIDEHGEIGAALLDYYDGDLDEAQEAITDRYMGEHSSLADYVQELTEETTTIPEGWRSYYHPMGTIEAHGGDVVAQVTAWLDEQAQKHEWQPQQQRSKQGA